MLTSLGRRAAAGLTAAVAGALLLAGCGSTQPTADTTPTTGGSAVEITDMRGKQIRLDRPAQRVVTLEWVNTENALALGVTPVGVSDPAGFATWDTAVTLPASTPDVGQRTEPNVEAIAKAQPDLILGIGRSVPDGAMAQLEKIAPVALLPGTDVNAPLPMLRKNLTDTAHLLGRDREAAQVLTRLDESLDRARTNVEQAGAKGRPFAFVYPTATGSTLELRMHGPGAVAMALASDIGLSPVWTERGDDYAMSSADLEAMRRLPENTLFTWWYDKDNGPKARAVLDRSAVWKNLSFVKAGHAHPIAEGIWVYGGPLSAIQWVEAVSAAART